MGIYLQYHSGILLLDQDVMDHSCVYLKTREKDEMLIPGADPKWDNACSL